jgi:hypothetical protein
MKSRLTVLKTGGDLSLLQLSLPALFLPHSVKERLDTIPGAFPESLTLFNRQVYAVRDELSLNRLILDGNPS